MTGKHHRRAWGWGKDSPAGVVCAEQESEGWGSDGHQDVRSTALLARLLTSRCGIVTILVTECVLTGEGGRARRDPGCRRVVASGADWPWDDAVEGHLEATLTPASGST